MTLFASTALAGHRTEFPAAIDEPAAATPVSAEPALAAPAGRGAHDAKPPQRIAAIALAPVVIGGVTIGAYEAVVIVGILATAALSFSLATTDAERSAVLEGAKQRIAGAVDNGRELVEQSWNAMADLTVRAARGTSGGLAQFMRAVQTQFDRLSDPGRVGVAPGVFGATSARTRNAAPAAAAADVPRSMAPVLTAKDITAANLSGAFQAQVLSNDAAQPVGTQINQQLQGGYHRSVELVRRFYWAAGGGKAAHAELRALAAQLSREYAVMGAPLGELTRPGGVIDTLARASSNARTIIRSASALGIEVGQPLYTAQQTINRNEQSYRQLADAYTGFVYGTPGLPGLKQFQAQASRFIEGQAGGVATPLPDLPALFQQAAPPATDAAAVKTAYDHAREALGRPEPRRAAAGAPGQRLAAKSGVSSAGAGAAVPPGDGTRPPGGTVPASPPPPSGGPNWTRNIIKGAVVGATLKGIAYAAKHRDKSPAELVRDPGIWIAITQGGVEGAMLGGAVSSKLAYTEKAALIDAIKKDFVFSGLIAGTADLVFKTVESGVDFTDREAVGRALADFAAKDGAVANTLLDFGAIFLDTGTDWAALGSVPSAIFKVNPAEIRGGGYLKNLNTGQHTRFPYVNVVAEEYWKNFLAQTGIRALLGISNDIGNQAAANRGDLSKTNGNRALASGLSASLYPAAMQVLQRTGIALARLPGFERFARSERIEIRTPDARGVTFRHTSNVSDTKTPLYAYLGRAAAYGLMLNWFKRETAKGLTIPDALTSVQRQAQDLIENPAKVAPALRDPEVKRNLTQLDGLSLISVASLLGGYVPGKATARMLDELPRDPKEFNALIEGVALPQPPATEAQWADPQRVARFHRELDQLIRGAHAKLMRQP